MMPMKYLRGCRSLRAGGFYLGQNLGAGGCQSTYRFSGLEKNAKNKNSKKEANVTGTYFN